MKTFPDPIMERLILERIKFEYANEIPPDVLTNLTIEQIVNFETKAVRTFFRTFIPGREVRRDVIKSVVIYDSWWEHFKKVCFPESLKRFFPVRTHAEPVVIRHYHLCPHTGIEADNRQKEVCLEFLKGVESEDWMKPFIKIAEENQFGRERE